MQAIRLPGARQMHTARTTSMGTMTDCVAILAMAPPAPLHMAAASVAGILKRSHILPHASFTTSKVVRYT